MAFSAVTAPGASGQPFVEFLRSFRVDGTFVNLNTQAAWWDYVQGKRAGAGAKEIEWSYTTGLGPSAFQALGSGTSTAYPTGQYSEGSTASAKMKLFGMTMLIPMDIWHMNSDDQRRYVEPIARDMDYKKAVQGLVLSAQAMGDGSGAIGQVASAAVSGGNLVVTLDVTSAAADRSHVDWFIEGDKVHFAATAGTAQAVTVSSGTISYYKVESFDITADTVTIGAYDASDTKLTVTAANDVGAADLIYRQDTTANDLSAISSNDYNTISEVMAGFASLAADDGRVVHGVTQSGNMGGTVYDASGALLDHSQFRKALSLHKRRNQGAQSVNLSELWMHIDTLDALINANEANREFHTTDTGDRGAKTIGIQYGTTRYEFKDDRFIPYQRIYAFPEDKDCLSLYGDDLKWVGKQGFQATPEFEQVVNSSGRKVREQEAFAEGGSVLVAHKPREILQIKNFTTDAA